MSEGGKLFNNYQLILVKGAVSMGQEKAMEALIKEWGFTDHIYINSKKIQLFENIYAGFFEGDDVEEVIAELEEMIHAHCKEKDIGAFGFLLIDATETDILRSDWHDGFY